MQKKAEKAWWEPALEILGEITGWIVGPILAALFLGRYLDEKNNSQPWFFLGLTGLAFIITSFGITKIAVKYIRSVEIKSGVKTQKIKEIGNKKDNK